MKNIFLTGEIQVGKSTILNSFLKNYQGIIAGFKTAPYFEKTGEKTFVLKSLNPFTEEPRTPQYICRPSPVNGEMRVPVTETFENFGVSILKDCLAHKTDLIIMDELGIFETNALNFQKAVCQCLDSKIPVLGVIKNKKSEFLDQIRSREDIQLIPVVRGQTLRYAIFEPDNFILTID